MFEHILSIVETVKWPLVAVFCLLLFRKQIISLLSRVNKIGPKSVDLTPPDSHIQTKAQSQNLDLKPVFDHPELRLREDFLKNLFDEIEDQDERYHTIIRSLAYATLSITCDEIYYNIYGSQIYLLTQANIVDSISYDYVHTIYTSYSESWPDSFSHITIDVYIGFLTANGLLTKVVNSYKITPLGSCFLEYLIRTKRNPDKPF